MSKITALFKELKATGKKGLIPFITAGDPDPKLTVELMHALVRGGSSVIELGVPFSDPMADGPVIQRSSERALTQGVTLHSCLEMVKEFRKKDADTPVVLMGYANPVEQMGADRFATEAKAAGVDGVLIVDYPPEECVDFAARMRIAGIDPIFLLAPTSTDERIAQVGKIATGYVYYVSLKGVTGSGALDLDAVAAMIPRIKKHVNVPVGVGFGIRDAATAARIAGIADAVVVGSRIIEEIEKSTVETACANVKSLVADIRRGVDEVKK
jgi:tryptophan synthase alpha chain